MAKDSLTLDQLYNIVKNSSFQAEFTTLFSGSNKTSPLGRNKTWKLSQPVTNFSMIEIFVGDDIDGHGRENWYCLITPDVLKNSNRSLTGCVWDTNEGSASPTYEWFSISCLDDGQTIKCWDCSNDSAALQLVRGIKWSLKLGDA